MLRVLGRRFRRALFTTHSLLNLAHRAQGPPGSAESLGRHLTLRALQFSQARGRRNFSSMAASGGIMAEVGSFFLLDSMSNLIPSGKCLPHLQIVAMEASQSLPDMQKNSDRTIPARQLRFPYVMQQAGPGGSIAHPGLCRCTTGSPRRMGSCKCEKHAGKSSLSPRSRPPAGIRHVRNTREILQKDRLLQS